MSLTKYDARNAMRQLNHAFNYIRNANTLASLFTGITMLEVLLRVYPSLPQAIIHDKEIKSKLFSVLHVLLRNLDFSIFKDENISCLGSIKQLAPCFKTMHIDLVLPKITEAVWPKDLRGEALDVLTALLKRLGELDPPKSYLREVCSQVWKAISKPVFFLWDPVWHTLNALSRLLTAEDKLATEALNLAMESFPRLDCVPAVPTPLIAATLQDLAMLSNIAVKVNLREFNKHCIECILNSDWTELEDTLSRFTKVCITVGGFEARSACNDLNFNPTFRKLPKGSFGEILRLFYHCAPSFSPRTALRAWMLMRKLSSRKFWALPGVFMVIAPRLSDQGAELLFKLCLEQLQSPGKCSENALMQIEALSKRSPDRTRFAQAATEAIRDAIPIVCKGDENDYATCTLRQACKTLGAMSATDCSTLLETLRALLNIMIHPSGKIQPIKASASMAMAQIIREATPLQRPLLSSFLFELDVVERDVEYFQPVWEAYISTLQNEDEANSAYDAFVRGAYLSKHIKCDEFWDIASILLQRLHGEKRDAWLTALFEAAKEYDWISAFAEQNFFAWEECLTLMVKMSREKKRSDILGFLISIGTQARESGMLLPRAVIATVANDSSRYRNLWQDAMDVIDNSESQAFASADAGTTLEVLYEASLSVDCKWEPDLWRS